MCNSWKFLTDIVIGIGAFCHGRPVGVIDHYLESAVGRVTAEHLETATLTLVQAYCLLSILCQQRNKPNASTVYLGEQATLYLSRRALINRTGIAMRMAVSLGMHLELPLWKIPAFEAEIR